MRVKWDPQACAAIDALRSGVVNRHIARSITYGRDAEIAEIEEKIEREATGSCQLVIGRYGVGKSHLCEVLDERLQEAGYAVAKLELGAAHGRAENPDAVLATVARTISARIQDVQYRGSEDLSYLALAADRPKFRSEPLHTIREQIYTRFPGAENTHIRYEAIREHLLTPSFTSLWGGRAPKLFQSIPASMTAANLAAAEIVKAAHYLRNMTGIKGIVLLLDEAERGSFAYNNYRFERAHDLLTGLARTSANLPTSHLKHYRDDRSKPYCPQTPSFVHTIFWFTQHRGLASELNEDVGSHPLLLEPFDTPALREIRKQVEELYKVAYGRKPKLDREANERIQAAARNGDTRSVVRYVVAALDHARSEAEA